MPLVLLDAMGQICVRGVPETPVTRRSLVASRRYEDDRGRRGQTAENTRDLLFKLLEGIFFPLIPLAVAFQEGELVGFAVDLDVDGNKKRNDLLRTGRAIAVREFYGENIIELLGIAMPLEGVGKTWRKHGSAKPYLHISP